MILLALALQTAAAAPPADAQVAEEVVVIGEKMKAWRATMRLSKKGAECKVKVSTGDAAIDRIGCTAMEQCWPDFLPRFEATRAKDVTAADRKTRTAALNKELGSCVMARRHAAIAALADQRIIARMNR